MNKETALPLVSCDYGGHEADKRCTAESERSIQRDADLAVLLRDYVPRNQVESLVEACAEYIAWGAGEGRRADGAGRFERMNAALAQLGQEAEPDKDKELAWDIGSEEGP